MCLGIPGQVVSMVEGYGGQLALVDVEGVARKVNIGLLDAPPAPGQWVLIHMGFVVELTDADGAENAISGLELMGRARAQPEPDHERAAIEALFGSMDEPIAEQVGDP
jgi:hydrogenase assembly chaperone HypC/HupF